MIHEFEYLSPTYYIAATKLLNDLSAVSSLSEIRKHFIEFYRKYTTLPFLWQKWLQLEENPELVDFISSESSMHKKNIINVSKKHFYLSNIIQNDSWMMMDGIDPNLFLSRDIATAAANLSRRKPTTMKVIEKTLKFPHFSLAWNKRMCSKYGTRPLSLKTLKDFKNSTILLQKISESTEKNVEATWWCKKIENVCEKRYIILSYEYKLAESPQYWNVWKSYITYLSETNLILMLTVYSRYCRLFIDDISKMNEYIQKLIMMNIMSYNVSKWWIDVIEFYRTFYSFEKAKKNLEIFSNINKFNDDEIFVNYIEWFNCCSNKDESPFIYFLPGFEAELSAFNAKFQRKKQTQKLLERNGLENEVEEEMSENYQNHQNLFFPKPNNTPLIHFSPKNTKFQDFSIHFNYIQYILDSSSSLILQKLFQSCKYFFLKQKKLFCYRFGIFDDCKSIFYEESLFLNSKSLNFDGMNGMIATNLLQVFSSTVPNATSLILQKINHVMISHLQLSDQMVTESEMDILSGDNIQTVFLSYITVLNKQNQKLKAEKIIEKFPQASVMGFNMFEEIFTADTSENLGRLKRAKNVISFVLFNAPQSFDEKFSAFIQNFVSHKGVVKIKFSTAVHEEYKQNFHNNLNESLSNYDINLEVF